MRQAVYWVEAGERYVDVAAAPDHVWELPAAEDRRPALPYCPDHGRNAIAMDIGHDWKMWGGRMRLALGGGPRATWILCEWEEEKSK